MKTLFSNARILTMNDGPVFQKGYLATAGSRISYIGETKPSGVFDEVVDCHGLVLMPGLKNAHTHSAMVAFRGVGEGLVLDKWLQIILKMETKFLPDDIYWLSQKAYLEYVAGGTTAFFDMYYTASEIARSAVDFGIRSADIYNLGSKGERSDAAEAFIAQYSDPESLVVPFVGCHAEYTTDAIELAAVKRLVDKYSLPFFTHVSETELEVKGCQERHNGLTPVQYFDSLGFFDHGGGGYHCIYLTDWERKLFLKKHLYLISCPGSNQKLHDGVAPLSSYWKEGQIIGLGTDGASSNDSLSLWREMRLAHEANPDIPPYEILKMATVNGARAMRMNSSDSLQEGKMADLILVDAKDIESLATATEDQDVKAVYIAGVKIQPDKKKILAKADEITRRLLSD